MPTEGGDPVLIRIIDTEGEWEDTGRYWGMGKNWSESFTLDKTVLHKVNDEVKPLADLYKQVDHDSDDDRLVRQVTLWRVPISLDTLSTL